MNESNKWQLPLFKANLTKKRLLLKGRSVDKLFCYSLLLKLMRFSITLRPYHLRVLASVFADLTAGWLIAVFNAESLWVLTGSLIGVIFSLRLAFETEKILEKL